MAEQAVATGAELMYANNSDNVALASVDVETSQVLAMVGSVDWNKPIYGEVNATTSLLEPGSTIKPILDYAALFSQTDPIVFGPGTILRDENIDALYCAGNTGPCSMTNATGKFYGDITVRESLSNSLNIGAVKALAIVGVQEGLKTAHALGDVSYCANEAQGYGLSIAIGSGCGVKMIEHANAYASIARGGTYKDLVYVLEVKDQSGKVLESWSDTAGTRAIDEQVAYELSSILSDAESRAKYNFGQMSYSFGFIVPGVWTASKTGTTTTTNSAVTKDSWMASYSTAISTVVWNGNHDGSGLTSNTNQVVRRIVNDYMENVHKNLYAAEGKWKSGDQPVKPSGLQELTVAGRKDIWPSWYSQDKSGVKKEKKEFNKYNHKLASACTERSQIVEVEVTVVTDPITKKEVIVAPEPYDYKTEDDCMSGGGEDSTSIGNLVKMYRNGNTISIVFSPDSLNNLVSYNLYIDGKLRKTNYVTANTITNGVEYNLTGNEQIVTIEVIDTAGSAMTASYPIEENAD